MDLGMFLVENFLILGRSSVLPKKLCVRLSGVKTRVQVAILREKRCEL